MASTTILVEKKRAMMVLMIARNDDENFDEKNYLYLILDQTKK